MEGSFSPVSKTIFASKYAFFSIFRYLQESKPFASLQTQNFANFSKSTNILMKFKILLNFCVSSGAKVCKSCSSRKTLKNDYLDAKIGVDTEENEPSKVLQFYLIFIPPRDLIFTYVYRPLLLQQLLD